MNVWYRQVISIGQGFNLANMGKISRAIKEVLGDGGEQDHYGAFEKRPSGTGYRFETEDDSPINEDDENRLRLAIVQSNGAPCVIRIDEYYIEESDPSYKVWDIEGKLVEDMP